MSEPVHQPTKLDVRGYIAQRVAEHKPPPTQEEIRRRLGWNLIGKFKEK